MSRVVSTTLDRSSSSISLSLYSMCTASPPRVKPFRRRLWYSVSNSIPVKICQASVRQRGRSRRCIDYIFSFRTLSMSTKRCSESIVSAAKTAAYQRSLFRNPILLMQQRHGPSGFNLSVSAAAMSPSGRIGSAYHSSGFTLLLSTSYCNFMTFTMYSSVVNNVSVIGNNIQTAHVDIVVNAPTIAIGNSPHPDSPLPNISMTRSPSLETMIPPHLQVLHGTSLDAVTNTNEQASGTFPFTLRPP
jgi:hypothetical protein